MAFTIEDLEKLQQQLPDYRMELVDGEIILMTPSGYESEEVATRMTVNLGDWVNRQALGRVTGSSAGFILPNSNTRAPDVSFVLAERMRRAPRKFAQLAPDLMVEVKSPDDSLKKLRSKITDFLEQGTKVGILIHPEQRWAEIYRSNAETIRLEDGDRLTVPDLLPGWEVPLSELWSPVFEE